MKQYFKAITLTVFCTILLQNITSAQDLTSLYQFVPAEFEGGETGLSKYVEEKILMNDPSFKRISNESCYFNFTFSKKNGLSNLGLSQKSDYHSLETQLFKILFESNLLWKVSRFNGTPIDVNFEVIFTINYDKADKKLHVKAQYHYLKDYLFESALYNDAVVLQNLDSINKAILIYNEALNITATDKDAMYNRGICKLKLNDTSGACEDWNKIKSIDNNQADKAFTKYCGNFKMASKKEYPQNNINNTYSITEEMPEFPGGENALLSFIANNTQYPSFERSNGIQGTVYLSFIITATGDIESVKIIRGVSGGPYLGLEATRVILSMPNWKPGKQNGKAVNVFFQLPVRFTLR